MKKNKPDNSTLDTIAVGFKLKQARKGMGMNAEYVADLLGVSQQQISNIEKGKALGMDTIITLCNIYRVPICDILPNWGGPINYKIYDDYQELIKLLNKLPAGFEECFNFLFAEFAPLANNMNDENIKLKRKSKKKI